MMEPREKGTVAEYFRLPPHKSNFTFLTNFVRSMAVANAIWILLGHAPWHTGASGTFDTALMAMTVPLFFTGAWLLALIPILAAILYQGEGTAVAVLLVQIVGYFYRILHPVFFFPALMGFCLPTAVFFPWKNLVQDHMQRIKMWSTYFGHYWDISPVFIGFGWDTFRFRAPRLPIDGISFTWAHNDWLEILFENGIVGLIFALCAFIYILQKTKNQKILFCSWLGFGTCMMFYSPLRVVSGQLILIALFVETFKDSWRKS